MATYSEHIFRYGLREFEWEAEPDAAWICHLPADQVPELPPSRGSAMQRLDRGHDWSWRNGKFRLSAAGYGPDDIVRVWLGYGYKAVSHCGQTHPVGAQFCCMCGEGL